MLRRLALLTLASLALSLAAPHGSAARQLDTPEFKPERLSPPFEPVVGAPFIHARQVTNQVSPDELVLGVEAGGQARAYPLNVLTGPSREVINDTVGGLPVAAVWCPLCYNGAVYSRRVRGRTLTFGVAGLLWNRSLVMYDAETGSYWSSFTSRAERGALEGAELETLPSELTTWGAWRAAHPETTVLNLPRVDRKFARDLYDDPSVFVYGWSVGLQRYHCPLYVLMSRQVLNLGAGRAARLATYEPESTEAHLFSPEVGGRALTFGVVGESQMRDEQTGSVWDLRTGEATAGPHKGKRLKREFGIISYRQAWLAFYPKSKALTGDGAAEP